MTTKQVITILGELDKNKEIRFSSDEEGDIIYQNFFIGESQNRITIYPLDEIEEIDEAIDIENPF